ncbi:MAG TPA: efflux RND transporter periplasmic adaptor subunit [Steroidobacteraceae bacterium]|nr:efflux RND transporter periplasmic adaptor subunit [Steroidobacteraceae bacterium]
MNDISETSANPRTSDHRSIRDRLAGPDNLLKRRLIIAVVAVVVLIVVIAGIKTIMIMRMIAQAKANGAPVQTVTATTAAYSDWQPEIGAVGSVRAVKGVDITTEVTGLVRSVDFRSGDDAKRGQVLVHLNADADIATLHSLEAGADLAATVYARDKMQFEAQAISQAQLDADAADLKNKRAQAAAQAALVEKKTLRAPFDGRLGITTVNPGQYLNTGDKVVTLQELDPVYVDFHLPQEDLAQVHPGLEVRLTLDAFPGESFAGRINAVDPLVDSSSRNFQAEATVANPAHRLLPGMFARVTVLSGAQQHYLTLPQTSITFNPYGSTVFLVQKDEKGKRTAQQTFVTTGPTRGDQIAVLKGIKEGDEVVTSGQLKLKNGTPIDISSALQPSDAANPTPQEH